MNNLDLEREEAFRNLFIPAPYVNSRLELRPLNQKPDPVRTYSFDDNLQCPKDKFCLNPKCPTGYMYSLAWFLDNSDVELTPGQNIDPRKISCGSAQKLKFNCPKTRHSYTKQVRELIGTNLHTDHHKKGKRCPCPECANQDLCYDLDCDVCRNASLEPTQFAKYWAQDMIYGVSVNGGMTPRYVFKASRVAYWFACPVCHHLISKKPNDLVNQLGCNYCNGVAQHCWDPHCTQCH